MSVSLGKLKGRKTRNSQRLYNLAQQEKLYKKLGISAMPGNKTDKQAGGSGPQNKQNTPKEETNSDDNTLDGEAENADHEVSNSEDGVPEKTEKPSPVKKSKTQKRAHSLSSESDSEREKAATKKKKRKKTSLGGKKSNNSSLSSNVIRADVHRLADGSFPQRGQGVNLNANPLVFPQNLMMSPADSGIINAHMSAYTKFLMDNNMLIGQGNSLGTGGINQNSQLLGPQTGFANQNMQGRPMGGFQAAPSLIPPGQGTNLGGTRGILDDSSLDGNSNADPLDFLPPAGTPASVSFLPQLLQETAPAAPLVAPNVVEEVLLSQHCEAEKEVDQVDDSAVGPEVSEQIMLMVQNFLGRSRKAAKIDELAQEFLRPKNMPFLKSPKIEEEIYLDLSGQAKHFDKNCRCLQGYLSAGMTALMRCIQTLIELEKLHPKITQAGIQAKKALQLMAFTNRDINDRRKDALKVAVNADYLPLLKNAKPPSEDWLLGGSLSESIKQIEDSKKMTEKLMKNKKNNSGGQQEVQQNFQQNQFGPQFGKQKYRNRFNKKDKNQSSQNYTPRPAWNSYQPQQYHQHYQGYQQQGQQDQQQLQLQYQQFLNNAYQTQQQQTNFVPQYQHNQNLGFQQTQYPKNFQQPNQQFHQKKKN